ncbi:MAG: N4-gp56 family major capsid protein [Thermosipho sp. (in: Bacteria)]|nr:N4-gp56 family major capsid protein [Thermosipho sp. (in: thermotogales)]
MFIKKFFLNVYAESQITTVVNSGTVDSGTAVVLDNAVRAVYSKEIEFKAMPNMRFLQFATIKTELGVEPGLTINMLTYDNLKMGGALTEGVRMSTQALSSSMKQITVGERGNAISVSELTLKSAFDDVMATASTLLARDMALVLDCELRDTLLNGLTNTIYARKSDGTKVSDRSGMDKTCTLSVATIKDAVEILATNNAPKFDGNYYVCFVHPHQSRTLRDDPAWIEASKYGAPDQLFTGEIGRIDDVRFIETTLMTNGAAPVDDPAYDATLANIDPDGTPDSGDEFNIYKAVIFGENTYGLAIALPVELRDNGVTDFGREHGLAWYAIWGAGILHDNYGVVIETA